MSNQEQQNTPHAQVMLALGGIYRARNGSDVRIVQGCVGYEMPWKGDNGISYRDDGTTGWAYYDLLYRLTGKPE